MLVSVSIYNLINQPYDAFVGDGGRLCDEKCLAILKVLLNVSDLIVKKNYEDL